MDGRRRALKTFAIGLLPAALFPSLAAAKTDVRFAHAVPGAGSGELLAVNGGGGGTVSVGTATFGAESPYRSIVAGPLRFGLRVGGKIVSTVRARLRDGGHYTVLAIAPSAGPKLLVVPDGTGRPGTARVRVIHAAPELGSPDVAVDGKTVAHGFRFGAISPYFDLTPGKHTLAAMRPGVSMPVLKASGVPLAAGSATTVLVVGTRGQKTRFVLTHDPSAAGTSTKPAAPKPTATRTSSAQKKASAPAGGSAGVHVVKSGECLWTIVAHHLGGHPSNAAIAAEVQHVWHMNSSKVASGDPNVILPGLRLQLS
jgi:Domain of unknown function (DUF4397)